MRLIVGVCLIAVAATGQPSAPNVELAKARKSIENFKYPEAAAQLDAVWAAPNASRAVVLELLSLQGVVAAFQGQPDRARAAFRMLLCLAPDYQLKEDDLGPKVTAFFYEAKGRMTVDSILRFEPGPAELGPKGVHAIAVVVKVDPLKLARQVRFHLVGDPQPRDVALVDGRASTVLDAPRAEWWAELLGDKQRSLVWAGSAEHPIVESSAPVPAPGAALPEVGSARSPRNFRPISYGLAGAGVVAGIVGAVFGAQSAQARSRLATVTRDSEGRVTSLTRSQGLALDGQVRSNATIANGLFAGAAVLVGAGVTLFLVSDRVAVTVAPGGGFGVIGRLP